MKKDLFQDSRIFWNTAQKFIHHYLPDIRKASNNTTASYRDGLNSYITFLEGKKGLPRSKICFSHLSEDYVKTFQDWLLNDKKVSARTSNLRLTALRSFMEYSAAEYKDLTAFYVAIRELLITLMSSLSQEESRSISENTTWGQRRRFADGKASVAYSRFLGYDKGKNGEWVVFPDQEDQGNDKYRKAVWRYNAKYSEHGRKGKGCKTPTLSEDEIKKDFVKAMNEYIDAKDEIIKNANDARKLLCDTTGLEKEKEKQLEKLDGSVAEFDAGFWGVFVEKMTVYDDRSKVMRFKDGMEITI